MTLLDQPHVHPSSSAADSPSLTPEPTWEIAKLFPNQGQWTEEEYLALNTNLLVEYSSGYIEVLPMPTKTHQAIVFYLARMLFAFVNAAKLGRVFPAPLRVKLYNGKYREPDIIFLKVENAARGTEEYCLGADLVMEVVSDDYRKHDLETKRFEYARSGIPEYWIVDPMLKEIAVLKLVGDHYESAGVYRPGEQAASVLLSGFIVEVTAVFEAN
jgi:Uma2 family endonuclease